MLKKIIVLMFIVLVACNSDEEKPMLTKKEPHTETVVENTKSTPVKKENLEVEFTLENEIITLNTNNIPILEAYLHTVQNTNRTIKKMKLTTLEPKRLYLLSFNCKNDTCSYLLLDRNKPNKSYLIDDLVTVKNINASPDQTKLFIRLQTTNNEHFQIFDLEEWSPIDFEPAIIQHDSIQITNSDWEDPTTIHITYTDQLENTEHTVEITEIGE